MAISDFFNLDPKPQKIVASRPIFQFSSAFIDGSTEPKRPPLALLRVPHQVTKHVNNELDDDNDITLLKSWPKPQSCLHLVLHGLNTTFTVVSLSLYITIIPLWDTNFLHARSLISGDYTDGLAIVPLLASLTISIYLLLTEHASFPPRLRFPRSRGPLRPRTLSLISLTILLTLGPTLIVSASNCLALFWQSPIRNRSGLIICNLANVFSQPCQPLLFQIGGLQIAAITMGGLAWCTWLVVTAVALRNWARDRKHSKDAARDRRRRSHARRRVRGLET